MSNPIFKNTFDIIRAGVEGSYLENQRSQVIWSGSHVQEPVHISENNFQKPKKQEVWQCAPVRFLKEIWPGDEIAYTRHTWKSIPGHREGS